MRSVRFTRLESTSRIEENAQKMPQTAHTDVYFSDIFNVDPNVLEDYGALN
jgi:hypothetical protein